MFRGKFLSLLAAAYRTKRLNFSGKCAHLATTSAFDRLLSRLKAREWVVYAKRPFRDPAHVIKYLARYTHRVAISNGRLIEMQDHRVTFRWRDSADGNRQKPMTLNAIDFIRRFLLHVLPTGFVKIRHFGFMANRHRRQSVALCRALLAAAAQPIQVVLTENQQSAIERKCPVCGNGQLHVIGRTPAGEFLPVSPPLVPADTS